MRLEPGWTYRVVAVGEVILVEPAAGADVPGGDLALPYWRVRTEDDEQFVVQEPELQLLGPGEDPSRGPVPCPECGGTGSATSPKSAGGECLGCGGSGVRYPDDKG
jgi:hypothetical protein